MNTIIFWDGQQERCSCEPKDHIIIEKTQSPNVKLHCVLKNNIENQNFCKYLYSTLFKLLRVPNFFNEMSCSLVCKCNKDVIN